MTAQTPRLFPALPALLLPLLVALVLPGCGEDAPDYEHTYTVRGVVVALPGEKATEQFMVHHEAIPDYVSINGSVGMREMVMPFPVPDRSVLEGIAVGDKIELAFGESFEPKREMGVIAVRRLAEETTLRLGEAAAPESLDE